MNKQLLFLPLLLLMVAKLLAASHYGFISDGFESSAVNLGMGGGPIAAVNYHYAYPLSAHGNPALGSLYEGFSYSGSDLHFMELKSGGNTEILSRKTNLIGLAYRGIGLLGPIDPQRGRYGTVTDYGEYELFDEHGNSIDVIEPKERSNIYGLSLNLGEFSGLVSDRQWFPPRFDLALGLNHIRHFGNLTGADSTLTASSNDLGILARLRFWDGKTWQWETALGASLLNAFNQTKPCYESDETERIYKRLDTAVSLRGAWKNPNFNGPGVKGAIQNYCTLKVAAGVSEEFASDPLILAAGAEYGLFDLLFVRTGYHYDRAGKTEGLSYGLGVNLHYRHLIGLSLNYAYILSGNGFPKKEIQDVSTHIDLLALIRLLQSSR